jgi:glycosyltransferase involved in cell wall biosynthesis
MPQVSVVVPSRNRRTLLRATLESILAQRGVELEAVVVDDGSTDGTAEDLAARGDPRLRVVRNEPAQGVARARNRGLDVARGAWVAFCDDDDLWAPDKLRSQLDAAERTGSAWCLTGVVWFAGAELVTYVPTPSSAQIVAKLPSFNAVPGGCSNVAARREVLAAVGGFDTRMRVLADWDLWIRLSRVSAPAVVDEPLVAYRLHPGNMSGEAGGVLDELRLLEAKSADLRGGRRMDAAWFHRWMGYSALRGGHRRDAAAAFLRAASWQDRQSVLRAAAALVAPTLAWRVARRVKPARPNQDGNPPAWLPPLHARAASPVS